MERGFFFLRTCRPSSAVQFLSARASGAGGGSLVWQVTVWSHPVCPAGLVVLPSRLRQHTYSPDLPLPRWIGTVLFPVPSRPGRLSPSLPLPLPFPNMTITGTHLFLPTTEPHPLQPEHLEAPHTMDDILFLPLPPHHQSQIFHLHAMQCIMPSTIKTCTNQPPPSPAAEQSHGCRRPLA